MTAEAELPPPEVEDAPQNHEGVSSSFDEANPRGVQGSVWRLGPNGLLISSVFEDQAGWLAEQEPNTIFFYADLDSSSELTMTEDTLQKVYVALSAQGLVEGQIIGAVSDMQTAGIYFREAAN